MCVNLSLLSSICVYASLYYSSAQFEWKHTALDPPLWTIVPNKALSLSLSLSLIQK